MRGVRAAAEARAKSAAEKGYLDEAGLPMWQALAAVPTFEQYTAALDAMCDAWPEGGAALIETRDAEGDTILIGCVKSGHVNYLRQAHHKMMELAPSSTMIDWTDNGRKSTALAWAAYLGELVVYAG